MKPKRGNPVHRTGMRNVFCPYYDDCLDHAVDKCWRDWDCSECEHKWNDEAKPELLLEVGDSIAYYDIAIKI